MKAQDKYLKQIQTSDWYKSKAHQLPKPSDDLGLIVCIPAYNEAELLSSLISLSRCHFPRCAVEVLININYPETASDTEKRFNTVLFEIIERYAINLKNKHLSIHPILFDNQKEKYAGVGLARKQIMDIAFARLMSVAHPNGLICGFDADSRVDTNYFTALENAFRNPQKKACSIRFEHSTQGDKYSQQQYEAIALYELHLRYYINRLKYIGTPFAFHTIGSSFAVRAEAYAQVNGMTFHKAGEDFYFLQKLMFLGGFFQLNDTCVYPSSRISHRVGFGTGPAVGDIIKDRKKTTFSYRSFEILKQVLEDIPSFFENDFSLKSKDYPTVIKAYLSQQKLEASILNFKKQHKTYQKFEKEMRHWFGGFRLFKMLNILSDMPEFIKEDVIVASQQVKGAPQSNNVFVLLDYFKQEELKSK